MRLKSVRIFGFKTFADRTEVNLDGGIIAVVGPNGCGKSNLVDAILWALGESNSRHLRAAASQDVIFSGSARRKPVGFAEVSLLFDNEDGSLPIDTPEVSITRRLNRAGESEYFINRRSCRQRDVHEVLADSGLGRSGYSIVGQKEIDQALAASAEDRRAWVDEAAGVQRYRARKIESVKRLASAKEHLVRVDDILRELGIQREPLRGEAEVATRYKSAVDALRQVETGLLMKDLAKATRESAALGEQLKTSASVVVREGARAEQLDHGVLKLRDETADVEHQMEAIRSRLQDAATAIERYDANATLGVERLRSLDELESTLRSGADETLIAEVQDELRICNEEAASERDAFASARIEVGGVGEEARTLAENLRKVEAELVSARQAQGLRLKKQAEAEHRKERKGFALRELEGLEQDIPGLTKACEDAGHESEICSETVAASELCLKGLEADLGQVRSDEDAISARVRRDLAESASLEGRRRGIEATIQTHEGLAQGTRSVLEAVGRGDLSGVYVPVGQAIESDREHALAIEMALGAAANDLIVEREGDAKSAIQYLKERRLGRTTFQPIALMRPVQVSPDLRRILNQPHVLGRASDLVKCDPLHRPVIESLLGRVIVVDSLDASLALAKTSGWNRIVTLDGEVVHSSGAVSGGLSGKQQYGLVQKKSDLAEIEKKLKQYSKALRTAEAEIAALGARRSELAERSSLLKLALERERGELAEAKSFQHTIETERVAADKSREKLLRELDSLAEEIVIGDDVEIDRLQEARDAAMSVLANRSADANQAKERLRNAEHRLQQALARANSASKRLEAARHSEAQRSRRLEGLGPERLKVRGEIEFNEKGSLAAQTRKKGFEADLRDAQGRKDSLLQESIRLTEEIRDVRASIAAMADANHQAELGRARADARRAGAAERLLEEYGISVEDGLAQADSVVVPPDAQPLATRLRRDIRAMGDVNVGAIEAYERLTVRHDELTAQRDDILDGIGQVQASMHELDKLTSDRFLETFKKVQEAYSEMFLKLFGGGEGRMFLSTPESILESGIEIEVTLPGKKRQRLELLSGGERALCAAGVLFALLHVKPSPLVVLDEVDAPLDGRNVERFADVLQEFSGNTQFILITHNPTTIERAPVWLGVTMQEPGVSTLAPVRLPTAS